LRERKGSEFQYVYLSVLTVLWGNKRLKIKQKT